MERAHLLDGTQSVLSVLLFVVALAMIANGLFGVPQFPGDGLFLVGLGIVLVLYGVIAHLTE